MISEKTSFYNENIHSPLILALDCNNLNNVLDFVDRIDPQQCCLKVGKEMFTLFGPQIIYELQKRSFKIFLDLKFHDIPNTCARAVTAAAELGVWMINVHAAGGIKMMTAAYTALQKFGKDAPLLIAVTMLTSMEDSDLQDCGIMLSSYEYTEKLALLTQSCGLDGIICSAQEAVYLKQKLGQKFKLITPGIRLEEKNINDDQRRITTPEQALISGVDYIIIGRPITQSKDPVKTLKTINKNLRKINNNQF